MSEDSEAEVSAWYSVVDQPEAFKSDSTKTSDLEDSSRMCACRPTLIPHAHSMDLNKRATS